MSVTKTKTTFMNDFHTAKIQKILTNFIIFKHLSRQKCAMSMILAMIERKSVQLNELALKLNDNALSSSNERRLQAFLKDAILDEDQVVFLLSIFCAFGSVDLCMDRTEWDFGGKQINMLVISGYVRGVGIPLYVELLDNNSGNSNANHRMLVIQKIIQILGKYAIKSVIGDREFVGRKWIKYLMSENIRFFLRVPKHYVYNVNGKILKAENLLSGRETCRLDGIEVLKIKGLSVQMLKVKNKSGEEDYLIVLTNGYSYEAIRNYKKRWSIEVMFQDFKGQGFNLEATHIKDNDKLKKLFYLVSIAYAFCVHVGMHYEKNVKKIPLKNHKYRAKSIFRTGLDILREIFIKKTKNFITIWNNFIDEFIHLARIKTKIFNRLKNIG